MIAAPQESEGDRGARHGRREVSGCGGGGRRPRSSSAVPPQREKGVAPTTKLTVTVITTPTGTPPISVGV
jgi:hypothetical protein